MNDDHAATKALPDDLLAYMRSHIKAKRDDLDGFLAIGNEVNRAATYDRWLVALSAPAAPVAQANQVKALENIRDDCMPDDLTPGEYACAVLNGYYAAPSPAPAAQPVSEPSPQGVDSLMLLADAYATACMEQGEAHDHVARDALIEALRAWAQPVSDPAAPRAPCAPLTDDALWLLWNEQGLDDMSQQEAIAFARAAIAEFCEVNGIGQEGGV